MHSIDRPIQTKTRAFAPWFLVGSILLHFTLLLSLRFSPTPPPILLEKIEFALNEDSRPLEKNEKVAPAQLANKQIVDQDQRLNDEVVKDTKYLAQHDQKVEHQTRAQRNGRFANRAQTKAASAAAAPKRARGELPALKDLIPKFDPGSGQTSNAVAEAEGAQTDDYLKDVEVGRQTLLTTREFVYFGYYSRIKESLRQHWEPEVRDRVRIAYRRGRSIASARDRLTQVLVTLDARGELIKIDLLTLSGVIDLDGAAVEAFKRAAPFPNPPKGMIEADGTVRIRWDFVLES